MKTCCFTGHRQIKYTVDLTMIVREQIERLIKIGVTDFYAGGALGWDMLCEQEVLRFRNKKFPDIRLHLILPCSEIEQTLKWSDAQKIAYHKILKSADSIEFVSNRYYNGCMKKRNQRLIELTDCCLCYYNNKKIASGTGQTVRMAKKKGIVIINAKEIEENTINAASKLTVYSI